MTNEWSPTDAGESNPERSIDLGNVLWGRLWLLLFFGGVGAGLGYLQYSKLLPEYVSVAKVRIHTIQPRVPLDRAVQQVVKENLNTHIEILTSEVVLRKAADKLKDPVPPSLSGSSDPMGSIYASLSVRKSPESEDILYMQWGSTERNDCPKVLTAVIEAYQEYLGESQKSAAEETLRLISKVRDDVLKQQEELDIEYQKFRSDQRLQFAGDKLINPHLERMQSLEHKRHQLADGITSLEINLSQIESARQRGERPETLALMLKQPLPADPIPAERKVKRIKPGKKGTVSKTPVLPKREKLEEEIELAKRLDARETLRDRLDDLSERNGRQHPEVVSTRNKLQSMDRKITELSDLIARKLAELPPLPSEMAAEPDEPDVIEYEDAPDVPKIDRIAMGLDGLHHELEVSQRDLDKLTEAWEIEAELAKDLSSFENKNREMQVKRERLTILFETIMKQLQVTEIVKDNGSTSCVPLSPPSPGAQLPLTMAKYIGLGSFLGVFLGATISYLLELSDQSFRRPEEIARQIQAPVLGHIPMLDTSRAGKKMRDPRLHATLATFHRPGSRESEAYRSVRAALFFGAKAQDRRVLQITSPNPGDGKSTLAANLAVAIASSGKKCLLIDADFRRPKVHRLFTLSNEKGVSSVIERETEILDAVQPSPINNLDIISAGPQSRNPAELILSPKFAEMLTLLKERYDFVLIDSPPILAVSDPSALAAYVDGVLLVVQITKRVRPLVRRSKETLDLIGARLIGVVVNGVGGETGSYGYNSGSYGYGYGYGNAGGGYSDNGTGSEYFNNAIPDDATAETVEGRS